MTRPTRPTSLPATVLALGWVSFCTDLGSEMVAPLLPAFVASLGAGPAFLGVLEGAANAVVVLLKGFAGARSDATRKKPWLLVGYGVSSLARPLLALAAGPAAVLGIRLVDRVGKGLRSAPRDALIAGSVGAGARGAAFGLQRAMDHAGAFGGAALAAGLLWAGLTDRTIFALAALPAAASMVVLWRSVREPTAGEPTAGDAVSRDAAGAADALDASERLRARGFGALLGVVALSSLATSIDLQLLLYAQRLGVAAALAPVLWMLLHVVRAGLAGRVGALSDRLGKRRTIAVGLAAHAAVLAAFAVASEPWHAAVLFPLHGLHAAFTEGPERGLVADLTNARRGGRAFGAFHLVAGLAALPLAAGFGLLLERGSVGLAFGAAAVLPLLALVLLRRTLPRR